MFTAIPIGTLYPKAFASVIILIVNKKNKIAPLILPSALGNFYSSRTLDLS